MVSLSRSDLRSLEYISSGTFGSIYKKDDNTAYKIYHDKIKTQYYQLVDNPALEDHNRPHYYLLLQRRDSIKQSGLIKDKIYMDGFFGGVAIPYYDGPELSETDLIIKDRIRVSRRIIDKMKELNRHLIYPTDLKTNNILLVNGEPELIDLDDVRTHAFIYPSPLFYTFSKNATARTVRAIIEKGHHPLTDNAYDQIERTKHKKATSYNSIEEYLREKEKEKTIIYIDKNTDIDTLKDNTSSYRERLVYVLDNDEKYTEDKILERLKVYQIPLYDFVEIDKQNKYREIESIKEEFEYRGKSLVKRK